MERRDSRRSSPASEAVRTSSELFGIGVFIMIKTVVYASSDKLPGLRADATVFSQKYFAVFFSCLNANRLAALFHQ